MKHRQTKKALALLLAALMLIGVFAACGNSDAPASGASKQSSAPAEGSTPASEPESSAPADDTVHPMRIVQPGTLSPEHDVGIAAVNEKLRADGVNIEVSVQRIPWDSYAEKLNMMLTTGEPFENLLVMQDVKNLSSIAAMNALLPIDEYLEKYPDLVPRFTELEWMGGLYNGQEYAIPCTFISLDKILSYMNYRSDIARKVGYEEFPDTVEGIVDLMEKSQAAILEENGMKAYSWMHQVQDTAHWLHRSYDTYPFYVENSLGMLYGI